MQPSASGWHWTKPHPRIGTAWPAYAISGLRPIVRVARELLEDPRGDAIPDYLRGLFGCESGEAYLAAEGALMDCAENDSAAFERLRDALLYQGGTREIGAVLESDGWSEVLAPEVLAMQVTDGCGADCFALILAADWMLASMVDVQLLEPALAAGVRAAVAMQCNVFYFG